MNAAGCRQWCETHDDMPTSDFVSFGPFRLFLAERLLRKRTSELNWATARSILERGEQIVSAGHQTSVREINASFRSKRPFVVVFRTGFLGLSNTHSIFLA